MGGQGGKEGEGGGPKELGMEVKVSSRQSRWASSRCRMGRAEDENLDRMTKEEGIPLTGRGTGGAKKWRKGGGDAAGRAKEGK